MRNRTVDVAVLVGILGAVFVMVVWRVPRPGPVTSPVSALDRCVQERFHTIEEFGMARLRIVPQHVPRFDPGTPEERSAVAELRRQGWTVGLYLAGRGLLQPPLSKGEWDAAGEYSARRMISKPILMTGETPAALPEPWELQEVGRKALLASTTSDKYETDLGRWSLDVRPIRANQKACLECHSTGGAAYDKEPKTALKIGDALGVVIYAYARTRS